MEKESTTALVNAIGNLVKQVEGLIERVDEFLLGNDDTEELSSGDEGFSEHAYKPLPRK